MASLHRRECGGWQVRFGKRTNGRDCRKQINLGKLTKRQAEAARRHIQSLVECRELNASPDALTRDWLQSISDELHKRLADKCLCAERVQEAAETVGGLCKHYLEWKSKSATQSSVDVYQKTTRMMIHHFGEQRKLSEIRPADVDDFIRWVYSSGGYNKGRYDGKLSATTASRRCQTAKSMFRRASRLRWIPTSEFYEMFESLPRQTRVNPTRRHWVEAKSVQIAIEHAANDEQRLIFALARWGGIRIPSELLGIEWTHVDRKRDRILIHSPKQINNPHKITRWIPIWPEIREQLDRIEPDGKHVAALHRSSNTSAHSGLFCRACYRAGLVSSPEDRPWPKLWLNMRSTRVTELRQEYPADVVNYWLNHSDEVSRDHYQQWEDFDWRK